MLNQESLRAVSSAAFGSHFIQPLYDSYCFSQIPQTLRYLLTDTPQKGLPHDTLGDLYEKYDCVVFFLVDGFGWRFLQHAFDQSPFLQRIVNDGIVSQITSQFPSTTTAHMTTIHTGLPVGESGLFEWFLYEPLVDRVITPLLFSVAGDRDMGTLQQYGVAPSQIYPFTTLYQELQQHGVHSFLFGHRAYMHSPYSKIVGAGAEIIPFSTLPEALVNLTQRLLSRRGRCYYGFYFDAIDSISHQYGPESPQVAAEIDLFLTAMERLFHSVLANNLNRTLFLMTADHGQTATDPQQTMYLNQIAPEIAHYLKTNRAGQPLIPAGSSRDMFLYIQDEHLETARAYLHEQLQGRAEVHGVADLIEQGFFGAAPLSQRFLERVGNLVILPYANESVWWYEQNRFEHTFRGHHGGLSRDEVEIGLLALRYG